LQSTLALPSILHRESTIRAWLDDPQGKVVFEPLFQMMQQQVSAIFGGDGDDEESSMIGMDMMGFLLDMPLLSVLNFQESDLPMPADEIVDALLRQVRETA